MGLWSKKIVKFFKAQKSVQTWLTIERNIPILKFKEKREKHKSEHDLSTPRVEVYIGIIIYCFCHTKIMSIEWSHWLGSSPKSTFSCIRQDFWASMYDLESLMIPCNPSSCPSRHTLSLPKQLFQELFYFPSRCFVLLHGWLSLQTLLDPVLILGDLGGFAVLADGIWLAYCSRGKIVHPNLSTQSQSQ